MIRASLVWGGRNKLLRVLRSSSSRKKCGLLFKRTRGQWCGHAPGPWQVLHSSVSLSIETRDSTRSPSVCWFFAASASLSRCLSAVASVAVQLTSLATTVQRAARLGCWGGEGGLWNQSQQGYAGKQVHVSGPTYTSVTWIWRRAGHSTAEAWKWVADGLPLFGGAQLAIDTTMVSPFHSDGTARRGAAQRKGVALTAARENKERTYLELAGEGGRAKLVVWATEVGGRWSAETVQFVSELSWAKVRDLPEEMQSEAAEAWKRRWSRMLSCVAAKSFVGSLLDRVAPGADRSDALSA